MNEQKVSRRVVPLRMTPEEFRIVGHQLVDRIAEHLDSLSQRPVTAGRNPGEIRSLLNSDRPLPAQGTEVAPLIDRAADLLFENSLFNGHPRFLGYITSSPAPIGMLGDFLASAVNANLGAWNLSPMATEIEAQTVRWIAELLGFPVTAGGLLVSGGNVANLVCFYAARHARAGWDVKRLGLRTPEAKPLRVYASAETHTWIQKAAMQAGLGSDSIRWIPTNSDLRMDVESLRSQIITDRSQGEQPFMVVGTAGSVSTGAIDPLDDLASLCQEQGLWFHVDGAYGAFAAAVPEISPQFRGMERADSIAVDPHKWLYSPLEAACALVRDPEIMRDTFSFHPPYYHFGEEPLNYVDFGIQNSRGFRALKVWLALQQAGRGGVEKMIRDDIDLARRLFERADHHPELEAATLDLSIATFRYVPDGLPEGPETEEYLNRLNQEILDRLQHGGELFVSNAVIRGRYLLRACVVNFNTTESDIEAVPEIVVQLGRRIHQEMAGS